MTDTPSRATNPTMADTDRLRPEAAMAQIPPTAAKGTLSRMSSASFGEPKAAKSRKKMTARVTGTMTASRCCARFWFSKAPDQARL